jgi:putative SOS response-associated peptidase YedK
VARSLGLEGGPIRSSRHNIAPTQRVTLALPGGTSPKLQAAEATWGLKLTAGGKPRLVINVRSETAAVKPSFASAFSQRRCLLPADGFYEWSRDASGKPLQAHLFEPADPEGWLLFAGLWEPDPEVGRRVAILTTTPNETVAALHDRMPVILGLDAARAWLAGGSAAAASASAFQPTPATALRRTPVGPRVDSSRIDDPSCSAPAPEAPRQLDLFDPA